MHVCYSDKDKMNLDVQTRKYESRNSGDSAMNHDLTFAFKIGVVRNKIGQ